MNEDITKSKEERNVIEDNETNTISTDEMYFAFIRKPSTIKSFRALRRMTRYKGMKGRKAKKEMSKSKKLKVRTDRSAVVLVTIVILFMVTHCYRLALKIYEVASPNTQTMENFKMCFALKR